MVFPNHAWLFDVDGVITNLQTEESNPELLLEIIRRLNNKEPVVLISGRSVEWLKEKVINRLFSLIKNPIDKQILYISGEFGGSYMKYKEGKFTSFIDDTIKIPSALVKTVTEFIKSEFSGVVFVDTTKRTMISVEKNQSVTVDQFKKRRVVIDQQLEEIINALNLQHNFVINSDQIATNIIDSRASKHYSIEQLLKWFKEDEIQPEIFVIFGDSPNDLEMGLELQNAHQSFKFVFVGPKEELTGINLPFPIIFTNNHFEEGTLEYFKNFC